MVARGGETFRRVSQCVDGGAPKNFAMSRRNPKVGATATTKGEEKTRIEMMRSTDMVWETRPYLRNVSQEAANVLQPTYDTDKRCHRNPEQASAAT